MIALRNIETVITFITISIAYIVCVTTAGFMQALVAQKMGDDTARQAGYLTWNPLVHIDPIGAFFLVYAGIGWTKRIPINSDNISGIGRLALVYFSNVIMYLVMAFCSLVILLKLFGHDILDFIISGVFSGYVSLTALNTYYPQSSSFLLVIALLLVLLIYLSVVFAVLDGIINSFTFIVTAFFPRASHIQEHDFLGILIPLIVIIFFGHVLKAFILYGILYSAHLLVPLLGVS